MCGSVGPALHILIHLEGCTQHAMQWHCISSGMPENVPFPHHQDHHVIRHLIQETLGVNR